MEIDDQTMEAVRRLAEKRQCSVEKLLKELLEQIDARASGPNSLLGIMADEPDLVDQVVESAMQSREYSELRLSDRG